MTTELVVSVAIAALAGTAGGYFYGRARGIAEGFAEGRRRPRKPKAPSAGAL